MFADLTMPRRRFLGAAGLGAAGLVLPGCATGPAGSLATRPGLCLPPVKVSRDRVIRETVGLRPYRDAGFVVRAEALGSKRLVHNYGHGGAGITLSWGTSKLATELGLQGHQGPVAVLGAGIVGLTTARLVQEAGFPVTIYAQALSPNTTSDVSAGQWRPSGHYRSSAVTPEWSAQYDAALRYAYRRFELMAGEKYGVRWIWNYFESGSSDAGRTSETRPEVQILDAGEHPFPFERVRREKLMLVEPPRFLSQLMKDIREAGGTIVTRSFASRGEVAALPEGLVFNCTGLGARALFGDTELRPVRGQLAILAPQPEVDYGFSGRAGYMFSRSDGIVLGGTYEEDDWSTVPDPATTDRLVARHQQVFDNFRC